MESLSTFGIITGVLYQFLPVWIAMAVILVTAGVFRAKLGLLGKLYDNPIGIIGFSIVLFWVLTALMADWIVTFDAFVQVTGMKNKAPGFPVPGQEG
ncbi:MAG: ABC transporter permease, partial [Pseudomonadota bacterium]